MSVPVSPPLLRLSLRTSALRTWLLPMSAVFTSPSTMSLLNTVLAA
jgi:hypothetical protein